MCFSLSSGIGFDDQVKFVKSGGYCDRGKNGSFKSVPKHTLNYNAHRVQHAPDI